jgi:hemolysin activation/secretion protein
MRTVSFSLDPLMNGKKIVGVALFLAMTMGALPMPSADAEPLTDSDPGRELRDMQERIEQERVLREMEERRQREETGIEGGQQEEKREAPAVKFVLKSVETDASEILPGEVVEEAAAPYIGREIAIEDLYKIVEAINAWYSQNHYLTCRAYLPPQTIHEGRVRIALFEGRNGTLSVEGNRTTEESYITDRLGIRPGRIENMKELDRRLQWFNGTNDVSLRIELKAGAEPGTTDYVIKATEPRRDVWTIYADRAGNETTGVWREGLFYTNRSLFGHRDRLSLGYIRAKGLDSFSAGYSFALGRSGTRLSLDYSTNATEVIDGLYVEWDIPVKGHAYSYGLTLTQPLAVSNALKSEASLSFTRSKSYTDIFGLPIIGDIFSDVTLAIARTNYGKGWAFYRRHALTWGNWDSDSEYQVRESKHYFFYHLNSIYQRAAQHGQLFTARVSGQWSATEDLRPSRQFFLGGVYSIRGYPENELGSDSGLLGSVEYSVPVCRGVSLYGFFDAGTLWGLELLRHRTLMGTGLGLRAKFGQVCSLDVAVGFPLEREVNNEVVGGSRVHLSMSANF